MASHPEQGWSLLCNGVVMFEDTGALLPDGRSIPPHQLAHLTVTARLPRLRRPDVIDLDTGHMAMISAPAELAAVLNAIHG